MFRPKMNSQTITFKWLIDLIPTGQDEAISMKMLSRITGLVTSDLRRYVLEARKHDILICSGDQGYYFPKDLDELEEYTNRRNGYIKTACVALHAFRNALKGSERDNSLPKAEPPSEARQTPKNGIVTQGQGEAT